MPKNPTPKKPPIIFLDIGGVLNSDRSTRFYGPHYDPDYIRNVPADISPIHVFLLNNICKETGAKVVLSSVWRSNHTSARMMILFKQALKKAAKEWPNPAPNDWPNPHKTCHIRLFTLPKGIKCPKTALSAPWKTSRVNSDKRGIEIAQWLKDYGEYAGRHVIIDDEGGMLLSQTPFFVKVDMRDGLNFKAYQQAVSVLQGKPLNASWGGVDINFNFSQSEDKKAIGQALTTLKNNFGYEKWTDAEFSQWALRTPVRTFQKWKRGKTLPNRQARMLLDLFCQNKFDMPYLLASAIHS